MEVIRTRKKIQMAFQFEASVGRVDLKRTMSGPHEPCAPNLITTYASYLCLDTQMLTHKQAHEYSRTKVVLFPSCGVPQKRIPRNI